MSRLPSLLFINQHYWPDLAATGQLLTDLCEHLAAEGYDVHVLCSRGHYLRGQMDVPRCEWRNGVTIHRLSATSFGRSTHLGRIVDYASFCTQTLGHLLLRRHYDLVVTLTTPPLLCVLGALLRQTLGQRYGIWSMDLHPDAEEALGMLETGPGLTRALHALNNAGYRNADFVVALGSHMKARLQEKGVASERLHTIPPWSRRDEIRPVAPKDNPLREELGLEDRFVVMYSGNAGLAHRFDEVLQMMRRLKNHPDIYFLFVGDGPHRASIEAFAERHALSNFAYLDYFPREALSQSLSLADVHLLTLRRDMAGIAVPCKLYGIMAAARPVVMVGPPASEPGETIETHGFGAVVNPGAHDSVEVLRRHLLDLYACPDRRTAMGRRGRQVFLQEYEQEIACQRWSEVVEFVS